MQHKFILDHLKPLEPSIKVMFGNHAIYIQDRIHLATRANLDDPKDNGIWIGTCCEHHESLKSQFPSLTNLKAVNVKKWLLLPDTADDFESVAIELCDMIKKGDPRIGVGIKR